MRGKVGGSITQTRSRQAVDDDVAVECGASGVLCDRDCDRSIHQSYTLERSGLG